MRKLKIDLTGKDATFLSNTNRYCNGLFNLELYRTRPDKVPSLEQLKEGINRFQLAYEAALNGDRVEASKRKKARTDLTAMFEKALHFLESVADEDDIPALLQAGFEVPRAARRKTMIAPSTG
ncbi:MAG: hypothetical protein A2075_13820 [Geobacteraceae bacterium GWC2_58_44]|nr:MAG: hypothetical protein A2075_13820 [Geobacteraceae bacterium GWC2_58_44]HBG07999.1 hypothetical protein [Geobacter sp.]